MLSEIREALVSRLAPIRDAGVIVRGLPNKMKEYGELNGAPQVLIFWKEDRPEAPEMTDLQFQSVRMDWRIEVRSSSWRDESGAEALLKAVNLLLYGWQPPHCQKLYLKSREFLGQLENYWVCEAVYVAEAYVVEAASDELGSLLTQIQAIDDFGGLTVGGIPV